MIINKNKWKNYYLHVSGNKRSPDELGEDRAFADGEKVNVITIADGISGAGPLSAVGADIITQIIVPFLEREFENIWGLPPEKLFTFLSDRLGNKFWNKLDKYCKENDLPTVKTPRGNLNPVNIEKYQTTVIACAVCENRMIFIKFGNGFAVICGESGAFLLSASKNEGFATPDVTLLSDPTNSEFEIGRYFLPEGVRSIALFSDGADYDKDLYDSSSHCIGNGYVRWIEHAISSEKDFKNAVIKLAKNNNISKDDVSVAVMFDEKLPHIDKIEKESIIINLYKLNEKNNTTEDKINQNEAKNLPAPITPIIRNYVKLSHIRRIKIKHPRRLEKHTNLVIPREAKKNKGIKKKILLIISTLFVLVGVYAGGIFSHDNLINFIQVRFISDKFENEDIPTFEIIGVPTIATAGTPLALTGAVLPNNATNQSIIWSVVDAGGTGAMISNNNILNTTEAGTVKVRATITNGVTNGDYTKDFNISVDAVFFAVTNITGVPTETTVRTPLTLTGTVTPNNATNRTISWSIVDAGETGASISDNILNTTAAGTVKIRATINNGSTTNRSYTKDFDITINSAFIAVTRITGFPTTVTVGTSLTLTGTVEPNNATNHTISWSIVNAGGTGANINGNTLNTTAIGIIRVRATVNNGETTSTPYTHEFDITVSPPSVTVSRVTINPSAVSVEQGKTEQFSASVAGTNTPAQTVTWTLWGNLSVSTFIDSNGLLSVASDEKAATLTITATSTVNTSIKGTATVSITIKNILVTDVALNKTSIELNVNTTDILTGTVNPSNATNKTLTWNSDNEAVATVDNNGNITAVGAGTATITVKTVDGNHTATCIVTVITPTTESSPSSELTTEKIEEVTIVAETPAGG